MFGFWLAYCIIKMTVTFIAVKDGKDFLKRSCVFKILKGFRQKLLWFLFYLASGYVYEVKVMTPVVKG